MAVRRPGLAGPLRARPAAVWAPPGRPPRVGGAGQERSMRGRAPSQPPAAEARKLPRVPLRRLVAEAWLRRQGPLRRLVAGVRAPRRAPPRRPVAEALEPQRAPIPLPP